jgi:hypothetical protein
MGGIVEGVFTWIDYFLVRCVRSVGIWWCAGW